MGVLKGILLKIASAMLFAVMSALVRWTSESVPVGQLVFYRSAFAILPVVAIYAWRNQLPSVVRTRRLFGHVSRGMIGVAGMFLSFAALARLPLGEVTAIGFAAPLMTVALAALILKERVRVYRWSAVGIGFVGVLVMLSPHLNLGGTNPAHGPQAVAGAVFALLAAISSAGATIQTRRLTGSETNSAIVFYFSLISALVGLATWPFGWVSPSWPVALGLVAIGVLGGVAQILMTESFRLAPASVVAPFDYTAILWTVLLGYFLFGEVPLPIVFVGAAIVIAAGLFVIFRERYLARQRMRDSVKVEAALSVLPDRTP